MQWLGETHDLSITSPTPQPPHQATQLIMQYVNWQYKYIANQLITVNAGVHTNY